MVKVYIFKNFRAPTALKSLCDEHGYDLVIHDISPNCGEINVKIFPERGQSMSPIEKILENLKDFAPFVEPATKTVSATLKEDFYLLECFAGMPEIIEKLVDHFQEERGVLGEHHFFDKLHFETTITGELPRFKDRVILSIFARDKSVPECSAHIDFLRAMYGRWPGMYWIQQARKHPDSEHPGIVRALKWMGNS